MPVDRASELIREFRAVGGSELVVTGGEPLSHLKFAELLAVARANGLRTTVFSMAVRNGEPISAQDAEAFTGLVDAWAISFHGSRSATHDNVTRQAGSFAAAVAAVGHLVRAGLEVRANFVLTKASARELPDLQLLAEELGISEIRVLLVVPQGRAASSGQVRLTRGELAPVFATVGRVGRTRVRLGEAARPYILGASDCTAVQDELVVNWDGWISRCHSVEPAPSVSCWDNAFRSSLVEVLRRSPRLLACHKEAKRRGSSGCAEGCIVSAVS